MYDIIFYMYIDSQTGYLADLSADLQEAGIIDAPMNLRPGETLLQKLMNRTHKVFDYEIRRILQGDAAIPPRVPSTPSTNVGTAIAQLLKSGISYQVGYHGYCSQVEITLLDSVSAPKVDDPDELSPIVITNNGEPISVIKTAGSYPTAYNLVEDSTNHLIPGVISSVLLFDADGTEKKTFDQIIEYLLPSSNHAWSLDISQADVRFCPLRFTTLMAPLETPGSTGMDHNGMRRRAAELLRQAHSLDPALLRD